MYEIWELEKLITVSSAYSWIWQLEQTCGRLFIKIENNNGPRDEPWGTPLSIVLKSEQLPWYKTHCCLWCKYELNQSKEDLERPMAYSLSKRR